MMNGGGCRNLLVAWNAMSFPTMMGRHDDYD